MSDGFLGRWSRRKLDAKEGQPLPDQPLSTEAAVPAADAPAPASPLSGASAEAGIPAPPLASQPGPPPTLDDVQALTAESDFTRFAARDVAPEVKNAALKKLFADPRYNVMDGMDVYVGDYSKPDPIPDQMLRRLAAAATLKLFDEPSEPTAAPEQSATLPRDVADDPTAQTVAQSARHSAVPPEPTDHADPDLRLQQDDAAAGGQPLDGAA
jgi:hypothetical protein